MASRIKVLTSNVQEYFKTNKMIAGVGVPTGGNYIKGDIIVNIGSNALDAPMWLCTNTGNPGTWIVVGKVADIPKDLTDKVNTIGEVLNLTTTNKSNLVAAINELNDKFKNYLTTAKSGDLNQLTTTNKSTVVDALNEVKSIADSAKLLGDSTKQKLVDKLISKGVSASTSETFEQLIAKMDSVGSPTIPPGFEPHDMWINRGGMPEDMQRYNHASAQLGDYIYVVGGNLYSAMSESTAKLNRFNMKTGTIESLRDCPVVINSACMAATDDAIYLFGGYTTGGGTPNKNTYKYIPSLNRWETKSQHPSANGIYDAAAARSGNLVYVFGGKYSTTSYTTNYAYDTVSNSFTLKSAMPGSGRHGMYSCIHNTDIYAISGRTGSTSYARLMSKYDVITETWTAITPRNEDMALGGCVVNGDIIHCIGSSKYYDGGYFAHIKYDILTSTWTIWIKEDKDMKIFSNSAGLVNGKYICSICGSNGTAGAGVEFPYQHNYFYSI